MTSKSWYHDTMKQTLDLGSAPHGEECAQIGSGDYETQARQECQAFANQLRRAYFAAHQTELPSNVRLRTKSNSHDFGTYYEVVVAFDDRDAAALEAVYWLEGNSPEHWDDEAKQELFLHNNTEAHP